MHYQILIELLYHQQFFISWGLVRNRELYTKYFLHS